MNELDSTFFDELARLYWNLVDASVLPMKPGVQAPDLEQEMAALARSLDAWRNSGWKMPEWNQPN